MNEKIKVCTKCKQEKSILEFCKRTNSKDGLDYICKKCNVAAHKKWYKLNKSKAKKSRTDWRLRNLDKIRNNNLIKKFGITLKQYNKMFQEQQGCCAVCSRHQGELKKGLAVDHNHENGEIRQLLCGNCNTSLGLMKDNVVLLQKLIEYVQKHENI